VMAPSNEAECRQMLSTGLQHPGPAAVRYPRGSGTGVDAGSDLSTLPIGKGELRLQGNRVALLAFGSTVAAAEQVGRELVRAMANQHDALVTIEDNVVAGGAGSAVAELLNAEDVLRPILHLGLPDAFQHHASREDLLAEAGIDAAGIRAALLKRWPQLAAGNPPLSAAG